MRMPEIMPHISPLWAERSPFTCWDADLLLGLSSCYVPGGKLFSGSISTLQIYKKEWNCEKSPIVRGNYPQGCPKFIDTFFAQENYPEWNFTGECINKRRKAAKQTEEKSISAKGRKKGNYCSPISLMLISDIWHLGHTSTFQTVTIHPYRSWP